MGVNVTAVNTTDEDLSRVTVMSPTRRVDLALPDSVTLGELLPSILRFSGHEGGTPQEAVHGWVLQRFGDDPLDPNQLIGKLGIRDGETLYLRQRDNAMPDAAFDDVVDGVTYATAKRPTWRPATSKSFAIAVLILLLVVAPLAMVVYHNVSTEVGERGFWGAVICLLLTLASAISAIAISRAAGEHAVSATLAWCSVALAAIGGWQILDVPDLPTRIVMTSALVLAVSTACALSAGVTVMPLFAAALSAGVIFIASIVAAVMPNSVLAVAAVTLAVALAMTPMMPSFSYKLAQIQLPALPPNAEALLADDEPVQSDIVQRAVLADRLLGALLTAAAVVLVLCSVVVVRDGHLWSVLLVLAAGLGLMMRARAFVGLSHRMALLVSGVLITAMGAFAGLLLMDQTPRVLVAISIIVLGAVFLSWYATSRYNKIISPSYGRWGDITEWISIMAIVPLLLGVLNTYGWVQSLFTGG